MLFFRYYLWIVPHLLLGTILIACLRRAFHRLLPVFFTFAAFEVFQFLVLFTVARFLTPASIKAYMWLLTVGTIIDSLLKLGVVYELANKLTSSRPVLSGISRTVFKWALAALLLTAAISAGSLHKVSRENVVNGFQTLDFASNLILAGMLVVLLMFSRALRISWRSWPTGVALGFGVSACFNLASAALRSGLGRSAFIAVDVTQMGAFHVSAIIWLIYVLLPERPPMFQGPGLRQNDIEFWDQELQRMTGS